MDPLSIQLSISSTGPELAPAPMRRAFQARNPRYHVIFTQNFRNARWVHPGAKHPQHHHSLQPRIVGLGRFLDQRNTKLFWVVET